MTLDEIHKLEALFDDYECGFKKLELLIRQPFQTRDYGNIEAFRFGKPQLLHFLVLQFASIGSKCHSLLVLLKNGHKSELMIIFRSIIEADNSIRFVMSGLSQEGVAKKQKRFVERFFEDNERVDMSTSSRRTTPQKQIIENNTKSISETLNELRDYRVNVGQNLNADDYEKQLSDLYRMTSNHTHGAYPELMSLYDNDTLKLSLSGNVDCNDISAAIGLLEMIMYQALQLFVSTILQSHNCKKISPKQDIFRWAVFHSIYGNKDLQKIYFPSA